jgi:hypothetical protein
LKLLSVLVGAAAIAASLTILPSAQAAEWRVSPDAVVSDNGNGHRARNGNGHAGNGSVARQNCCPRRVSFRPRSCCPRVGHVSYASRVSYAAPSRDCRWEIRINNRTGLAKRTWCCRRTPNGPFIPI